MSRAKTQGEQGQLATWVKAEVLQRARDRAKEKGEPLRELVERAIEREVKRPADDDDEDE
jgi:hypothetical protein